MRDQACTDPPRIQLAPEAAHGALTELIFLQVRRRVDLAGIAVLELELLESLGRTYQELGGDADPDPPLDVVAAALVEQAWRRVEAEWRAHRLRHLDITERLVVDDDDGPLGAPLDEPRAPAREAGRRAGR